MKNSKSKERLQTIFCLKNLYEHNDELPFVFSAQSRSVASKRHRTLPTICHLQDGHRHLWQRKTKAMELLCGGRVLLPLPPDQ